MSRGERLVGIGLSAQNPRLTVQQLLLMHPQQLTIIIPPCYVLVCLFVSWVYKPHASPESRQKGKVCANIDPTLDPPSSDPHWSDMPVVMGTFVLVGSVSLE